MSRIAMGLSKRVLLVSVFSSVSALLLACGGSKPAAEQPAPASTSEQAPAGEQPPAGEQGMPAPSPIVKPATKFEDMKHGDQIAYMKNVVMPTMAKAFQEVEPEDFEHFNCATCHGPGAKNGTFKMPNPELPALDFSDNLEAQKKEHPKMVQFMMEKVAPDMATLLGEDHYDPATGKGFGCLGCHTKK